MDCTRQSWFGPRKTFTASISSCHMKDSRVVLPHLLAPILNVASMNTRTVLPYSLSSNFSAASKMRGRSFVAGAPSTFSFLCRGNGPSQTRRLKLPSRNGLSDCVDQENQSFPMNIERSRPQRRQVGFLTRNRQNLGLRVYDAYVVLNACFCFLS